jgi:flagellar protein FlbT
LIYIFPEDAEINLARFASILQETRAANPGREDKLNEIETLVHEKNHYRALKLCRRLFKPMPLSLSGKVGSQAVGDGGLPLEEGDPDRDD